VGTAWEFDYPCTKRSYPNNNLFDGITVSGAYATCTDVSGASTIATGCYDGNGDGTCDNQRNGICETVVLAPRDTDNDATTGLNGMEDVGTDYCFDIRDSYDNTIQGNTVLKDCDQALVTAKNFYRVRQDGSLTKNTIIKGTSSQWDHDTRTGAGPAIDNVLDFDIAEAIAQDSALLIFRYSTTVKTSPAIYPVADTYVSQASPTNNYGTSPNFAATITGGSQKRAYLRFELPFAGTSTTTRVAAESLTTANLVMKSSATAPTCTPAPCGAKIQAVLAKGDLWTESGSGGITWDNVVTTPGHPEDAVLSTPSVTMPRVTSAGASTGNVNVLALIKPGTNPGDPKFVAEEHGRVTFAITGPSDGATQSFYDRTTVNTANRPSLTLQYYDEEVHGSTSFCTQGLTCAPTDDATVNANGDSQFGVSWNYKNNMFGDGTTLQTNRNGTAGSERRAYLRFNLANVTGSVSQAFLRLKSIGTGVDVRVYGYDTATRGSTADPWDTWNEWGSDTNSDGDGNTLDDCDCVHTIPGDETSLCVLDGNGRPDPTNSSGYQNYTALYSETGAHYCSGTVGPAYDPSVDDDTGEGGITWNNQTCGTVAGTPASPCVFANTVAGVPDQTASTATEDPDAAGWWILDVTSYINSDVSLSTTKKVATFMLVGDATNAVGDFSSTEGGNPPSLVIRQ
jgi:hypothetical protein